MATITQLKNTVDTNITQQNPADRITGLETRTTLKQMIDELVLRGIVSISSTNDLSVLPNTETKLAFVQNNGLFEDTDIGVVDNVNIFNGVSGRIWKRVSSSFITANIVFVQVNGDDTTGVIGDYNRPFATIAAALAASSSITNLIMKIGTGEFFAPATMPLRDNISIIGEGRPTFNTDIDVTSYDVYTQPKPTALVGGTIIKGTMYWTNGKNVRVSNLGVDVGEDFCNLYKSGQPQEGLLFAQYFNISGGQSGQDGVHPLQTEYDPGQNVFVSNVTVLGKGHNYAIHGLIVESSYNGVVENCLVACTGYGLILKTMNLVVNNIHCISNGIASIYIKCNDYSHFTGSTLTNIVCDSFTPNEGAGILIGGEAGASTLKNLNLSAFQVRRCLWGVKFETFTGNTTIINSIISNGIISNCQNGIIATSGTTPLQQVSFRNISIRDITGTGVDITNAQIVSISGIIVINSGTGFNLNASVRLDVCDILSNNNTISIQYGSNVFIMGVTSISGAVSGTPTNR